MSMTADELDTIAEAVERQRNEAADVPFPGPAPLDREHRSWYGRFKPAKATPCLFGHVLLGEERYPSRLQMLARLKEVQAA